MKIKYLFASIVCLVSCFCTTLHGSETKEHLFVNSMEFRGILSVEQNRAIDTLIRTLSAGPRNTKEQNNKEFYYIIEKVDNSQGTVTTTTGMKIQIGWLYRNAIGEWHAGNRLKIYYNSLYSNYLKLENIDEPGTSWGVISKLSEKAQDSVARIKNSSGETNPWKVIVLKSGWVVEGPVDRAFAQWKVKDLVVIFHSSENPDRYDLWNGNSGAMIYNCSFLKNEKAFGDMTNIAIEDVIHLQDNLDKRVLAQPEATKTVSATLWNYAAGLKNPETPIGVFLFLGPTGVGKTELAKALTQELYKDKEKMIRFDMSHFSEEWTITRLIGSAPGYVNHEEGGQLTESLKEKPQSVVLLDEIEKAHAKVRKVFLPVFDEGYITDSKDFTIPCNQTVFIMTSNICSQEITNFFDEGYNEHDILAIIEPEIIRILSPELYNRVTPIVFRPLQEDVMSQLVELLLEDVIKRVKSTKGIVLVIDATVNEYLIREGFHSTLGARPLKRLIEKKVIGSLAYAIISRDIPDGSTLRISYNEDDDSWHVSL